MNLFVVIVSIGVIALGALVIIRSEKIGMSVSKFYSNYPLVRLAGERQMKLRRSFIIAIGIVFVAVGVIALANTLWFD